MSLNGLDEAKVVEAHETAASEPGGWFLLQYTSRDEVELLKRGNGGIVEVRNAIDEYDETSPLYGFLRYRRRNVIIKYLPEDCSRIIQARVAVHFTAVCERFSPYDTAFEISTAAELKDTKLSAACSLHAASCSTSSSTSSLRRRRLVEIAEEEEEEQRAVKRQSMQDRDGDRPQLPAGDSQAVEPVTLNSQLAESPEHRKFSVASTSELPTFVGVDEPPTSPGKSSDAESIRPDNYSTYSSYPYTKPKVKLGPRPSLESGGRPQTAGNFRPVSAIPAGFKLFGKGSRRGKGSRDGITIAAPADDAVSLNLPPSEAPAAEGTLQAQDPASARPSTSLGVVPEPVSMSPPTAPKKPTITPEKARLMKAMKLREQKKQMSMQPPAAESISEATAEESTDAAADTVVDQVPEAGQQSETEQRVEDEVKAGNTASAMDTLSSSVLTDQTSDLTQSDSRPASPIVASSEAAQSTKASSISESTDETVRAKDEEAAPDEERNGEDAISEDDDWQEAQSENQVVSAEEAVKNSATASEVDERGPVVTEAISSEAPSEAAESKNSQPLPSERAAEAVDPTSGGVSPGGNEQDAREQKLEVGENLSSVALSDSKLSAGIPSSPKSPQEPLSTNVDTETSNIPHRDATAEPATSTSDNETAPSAHSTTLESKASSQDLPCVDKLAEQPTVVSERPRLSLKESPVITAAQAKVREVDEQDESDADTIPIPVRSNKRRAFIEPIDTDSPHTPSKPSSEANLSDDDELMNELQSATVQEAKHMSVAKTPVSATFPPSPVKRVAPTGAPTAHMIRTASNPVRGKLTVPTGFNQPSTRSVSTGAAYLQHVNQQSSQQGGNLLKKSNLGSSISQRIKALEKLSASSGDAPPVVNSRERPSSTFFAVKKREPSRSPSVMDRANSLRSTAEPLSRSNESSPEGMHVRQERSGSVTSRLSVFESPTTTTANAPSRGSPASIHRGRSEYVSVTARIIRDPNDKAGFGFDPSKDPSEYGHLDLKQSPLLVDHHKAVRGPAQPGTEAPLGERSVNQEPIKTDKPRQSSLGIVKDFIKERRRSVTSNQGDGYGAPTSSNPSRSPTRPPSINQSSSFSPRLSISSRRSSVGGDRDGHTSPTEGSFGDDAKSANGDKKMSRAGRFMRRLSNLSGSRGKNSPTVLSPSVAEDRAAEAATQRPATTGSPSVVSYMGDVNVQFPDNLLWKRRNMCLDSQGFIILSALPAQSGRQAQGTKRYHLSEFRTPYTPDVEVQELPNSVVLDFIEGASIQLACEDRAGQLNVLNILQEAHATRSGTYGL
ncbi:gpi-anchored cell surface glycoprotein [Purpureocillium lilacinum]|uniref:Gpi-anchored cell surface glycoprotein n=1 Tax=Purpureocillium lilacinum TaxID=33203 RepID=A0A179HS01_PURLI|nr:gpi-anchored cell surface glycoprotein [Purpureocillium lilacinum]OAQ93226.1 gpi-anchored cell surface glycoprotein [Purpureocillium lilacinum]